MVSSLVLTDRSRRVGVVAFVLAMVLLLVSVVFGVSVASADTTGISTSYKTGTDLTNGSTASSSAAPGGATTGTANPGDTIKWAVDYQNNTSGNASVDVKDPLTNGHICARIVAVAAERGPDASVLFAVLHRRRRDLAAGDSACGGDRCGDGGYVPAPDAAAVGESDRADAREPDE